MEEGVGETKALTSEVRCVSLVTFPARALLCGISFGRALAVNHFKVRQLTVVQTMLTMLPALSTCWSVSYVHVSGYRIHKCFILAPLGSCT